MIYSVKKRDRMQSIVEKMTQQSGGSLPACYTGYFEKFNSAEYYEAHDVLEHLWLEDRSSAEAAFYKGLIQLAGAFVHLRKQYDRPDHPKDGRRLKPAGRLFLLADANIAPYGMRFMFLDLQAVRELIKTHVAFLAHHDFQKNPWKPESPPRIHLKI